MSPQRLRKTVCQRLHQYRLSCSYCANEIELTAASSGIWDSASAMREAAEMRGWKLAYVTQKQRWFGRSTIFEVLCPLHRYLQED